MRLAVSICLLVVLTSGCHNGIRVNAEMAVHEPIPGTMKANMITVDGGPLCEIPVPPGDEHIGDAKIAIIDVDGIMANLNPVGPYSNGENPVGAFKEKLTAAAVDPTVRGVVLRINTPGGTVAATDLMYHELMAFRAHTGKPVVACILDVGAGGGYFLATGCDRIVAIPSALIGGIGVIFNLYWGEEASNKFEFRREKDGEETLITSGTLVEMGTFARANTKIEKKLLTEMAKEYHEAFKRTVLAQRPGVAKDSVAFDGRVMSAGQARDAGLIDSVGHLEEAVATVAGMVNRPNARTIMYCRKDMPARTPYAVASNRPLHPTLFPASIPGLDRTKANLFLYLWQADPTLMKLTGM